MTVIKGPSEVRKYRLDFSQVPEVADNGESISSIVTEPVVVANAAGITETGLTLTAGAVSSNKVSFTVSAGTLQKAYRIYCLVRTSASNDLEAYFDLRIEKTVS